MQRAAYSDSLDSFVRQSDDAILGALTRRSEFAVEDLQHDAWLFQISHLKSLVPNLISRFGSGAIPTLTTGRQKTSTSNAGTFPNLPSQSLEFVFCF